MCVIAYDFHGFLPTTIAVGYAVGFWNLELEFGIAAIDMLRIVQVLSRAEIGGMRDEGLRILEAGCT